MKKYYLSKIYDFTLVADEEIIAELNKKQIEFMKFLMLYQLRHYEKYGTYLIF